MLDRITRYRRELHQIPELELTLPKTQAYIKAALSDLPCEILEPIPYSVAAYFDNGKETTVAFRSDMDALAVREQTGRSFASTHEGCMHACGHDGHMAMLLGFAHELAAYYQELPHNVLLLFQPGEESPGGAELICKSGLLERLQVKRIFGFHLWPAIEAGVIATRKNEFMARSSEVNIDILGKSAHAAKYQEGIDALEIGMRYLQGLYEMEKAMDPSIYRLFRVGKFDSGTVRNVVSSHTRIEATLRAFQDELYLGMKQQIEESASRYEKETGAQFVLDINRGYPAVINDEALTQRILDENPDIMELKMPEMISEDFAHYQRCMPGVFFFLGTGTGIALHNSHFDFEEKILLKGIEMYRRLSYME